MSKAMAKLRSQFHQQLCGGDKSLEGDIRAQRGEMASCAAFMLPSKDGTGTSQKKKQGKAKEATVAGKNSRRRMRTS